jgi:integrase
LAYFEKTSNGHTRAYVERMGVRKSATWPSKREAEAWARHVEAELLAGKKRGAVQVRTFEQLATEYQEKVTAAKPGKRWEDLRIPKMIEHFADAPPLHELGPKQIAAWRDARLSSVNQRTKATISGATVLRESKLLRAIFEYAREQPRHWIETNPFDGVPMPKDSDARTARWRWQQIRLVLRFLGYTTGRAPQNMQQEVALAFLITLRTAMRSAEILRSNPRNINLATRVIEVMRKDQRVHKIPITRQAARVCRLVQEWTIDDDMRDALFRKARDACLVGDLTFHDARATALTLLARRVDVLTLARISGHKNLKMLSEVYYRETPEEIATRLGR